MSDTRALFVPGERKSDLMVRWESKECHRHIWMSRNG